MCIYIESYIYYIYIYTCVQTNTKTSVVFPILTSGAFFVLQTWIDGSPASQWRIPSWRASKKHDGRWTDPSFNYPFLLRPWIWLVKGWWNHQTASCWVSISRAQVVTGMRHRWHVGYVHGMFLWHWNQNHFRRSFHDALLGWIFSKKHCGFTHNLI